MRSIIVFSIFLFSLLNFAAQSILAQNTAAIAGNKAGSITGVVIDSVTMKPIDFMTIALKKENVVVKTFVTKAEGNFSFDKLAPGKYLVTAIAIGYNAKNITTAIAAEGSADLGKILVSPQVNTLKEVAVTGDKPIVKQEVDRISYDTQADPESKSLTVLDMMRKVPLLSLDAEDNIKLKGSGNYKILVNGKPSNMVARNPKDVLRSMPASSIQKIEVITTPPAKYDSEGLDGIINIITTKKIDNGYNASLNLRGQGPVGGQDLGGYLTLKQNNFGITAYGGTGFYSSPETISSNNRVTTGANATNLSNSGFREFDNNYRYGGGEMSFEIDTLNLISAEINPNRGYNNSSNTQFSRMLNGDQHINYDMLGKSRYEWGGLEATLNYQLGFKSNKERLLTFSYKYSNSSDPQDHHQVFNNRVNYDEANFRQMNESRSREQTIQVDYVHPLKKLNIEGGLKGILRDNNSNFEYKYFDDATSSYILDGSRTNTYDNNQDIIGAYNSYAINLKDWGFKAGVRIEGTIINADFISSGAEVNTDYFNIIPTFSINRKFKNMSSLNFGYTQRIQRPGIDYLNPFVNRSVPNFQSTGNPDLEAVLSNNFELRYSRFKKGSINIGLSYNFANNTVQNVSVYNETDNITYSTYLNIGKDRTLNTSFNFNYPLTSKWNISMSGNIGYKQIEGTINGVMISNRWFNG